MRLTVGRRLPVLVTVLLMVVNETTLGLLVQAGNMPWGLGEWPLWRVSLLVAAGIVVLSHTMCGSLEWTVPLLLIIAWLMPVVWDGGLPSGTGRSPSLTYVTWAFRLYSGWSWREWRSSFTGDGHDGVCIFPARNDRHIRA